MSHCARGHGRGAAIVFAGVEVNVTGDRLDVVFRFSDASIVRNGPVAISEDHSEQRGGDGDVTADKAATGGAGTAHASLRAPDATAGEVPQDDGNQSCAQPGVNGYHYREHPGVNRARTDERQKAQDETARGEAGLHAGTGREDIIPG
jgi:hypothetical protein